MDIPWNQLEIGEFFSDNAKASGCRSTPKLGPHVRFRRWFQKLVEPSKAFCIVFGTELCYADRGALVFTSHANSEVHQQKFFEPSLQILPCLEWSDACLFM